MINDFKFIKNKTLELEESLEKIHKEAVKTYKHFKNINKNFINYSIINFTEIELYSLRLIKNSNIYFSLNTEIYLPSTQNIEASLLVNNICISKVTISLNNGNNVINLNKDFVPLSNSNYIIKLSIKSLDDKQIELKSANLFIYGINEDTPNTKYQVLELNNKLLLSYLDNEELYYYLANKNISYYNALEFNYFSNAKDYSFVFNKKSNEILLFKIDNDNNLTQSKISLFNYTHIDSNVSSVSAVWGDNKILLAYTKNLKCYYLIIENNSIGSVNELIHLDNIKNIKTYYNEINNKFYIVLTNLNNQNYLIESLDKVSSNSENIYVEFDYTIETFEVNNEV